MNLSKINVFKSNMGRFMPKKLKCRKLLKDEEQLFLHGLKLYHKKIYLANFLKRVDVIEEQVTEIKETLGGRFARSLESMIDDTSVNCLVGPAT